MNFKLCQNIHSFIINLHHKPRQTLYNNSYFTSAFLKTFNEETLKYIFDLSTKALSVASIKLSPNCRTSLRLLKSLDLIEKKNNHIFLNETFKKSLFIGFCDLKNENTFIETNMHCEKLINNINKYENTLYLIVNKFENLKNLELKNVLLFIEIINSQGEITNNGFEFLLKTKKEQLWILVLAMIKYIALNNNSDINFEIEMIEMLFELSLKKAYKTYKVNNFKYFEKFLNYLQKLGLINLKGDIVFISELFTFLFTDEKDENSRFLVLESNFKLYAYTKSQFDQSVLSLFSNLNCFLPGLIIGNINEDTLNCAFNKGITANQITHYIKASHKIDENEVSSNVIEQIHIWESQRNRIQANEAYMFYNFLSLIDYQRVISYCKENKMLIDNFDSKRLVFVKKKNVEKVKEYINKITK